MTSVCAGHMPGPAERFYPLRQTGRLGRGTLIRWPCCGGVQDECQALRERVTRQSRELLQLREESAELGRLRDTVRAAEAQAQVRPQGGGGTRSSLRSCSNPPELEDGRVGQGSVDSTPGSHAACCISGSGQQPVSAAVQQHEQLAQRAFHAHQQFQPIAYHFASSIQVGMSLLHVFPSLLDPWCAGDCRDIRLVGAHCLLHCRFAGCLSNSSD